MATSSSSGFRSGFAQSFEVGEVFAAAGGAFVGHELLAAKVEHSDSPVCAGGLAGPCSRPLHAVNRGDDVHAHRRNAELDDLVGSLEILSGQLNAAEAEFAEGGEDALRVGGRAASGARQALTSTLVLRKSARSFRVQICGPGDYVTIAKAYREVAKAKGWLVPWSQKLKGHPERAKLFGAVNYKLWSTLSRSMNEESTQERSVSVNWTFDEAAQVAEHLKNDLKLDRVLFIMGGWIHRGYDNQHPDILPAAPECGGDAAFADCCPARPRAGLPLLPARQLPGHLPRLAVVERGATS